MGDISELRGIVVIGSFLGILVLLIGWIPAQFYASDYEGRTINVPEYFEAIDLERYAVTKNYSLDGSHTFKDSYYIFTEEIGGNTFDFCYRPANTSAHFFFMRHVDFWWIFAIGSHYMNLYWEGIDRGVFLTDEEVNDDYDMGALTYMVKCEHVQLDVMFAFNETLYSSPSDALDHYDLYLLVGAEWDEVQTSMSAWDVIGMLLFFQLPNIHWTINAIIAIPIWLCIAYVSYILILRTIGAIFGGGA